jgi:hypothetical protein
VSLGKPLKFKNSFVYIRDTILLVPGDYTKRIISYTDNNKMSGLLERYPKLFEENAIQDAVISLKHSVAMEQFNMTVLQIGIPLTLSSIGRKDVFKKWVEIFNKYLPYQMSGEYMMGNAVELQTPKGLATTKETGTHMSYFIANYKGGRNESFMYGVDEETHWYDLT